MAMFGLFAPRYVKEARDLLKNAHKLLCYKKDIWNGEKVAAFEAQMKKLSDAVRRKDEKAVDDEAGKLDSMAGEFSPVPKDAAIRENCEVLLVAIIVALGVRSYFLQPFAIPTGSMQPTLNGIIGHATGEEPPNFFKRACDMIVHGRSYVNVICKADGVIEKEQEYQWLHFFTYTRFECGGVNYTVKMPSATLNSFLNQSGLVFKKGEPIVRGYVDAGDHVFVDKFSYNFHPPRRGDVFVFNTAGIPTGENVGHPEAPSQFYIKRVGGVPGDELRIDPPLLYQNGKKATAPGYLRVMQGTRDAPVNGYRGYSNDAEYRPGDYEPMHYLTDPQSTFKVPLKCYFALGDNSYRSSDSRDWGTVPQRNIVGKGLFVFWPFVPHWGFIQ